ncbi:hypothetical protein [Nocardia veterana]|uniref:DUF8175 domain-containing protein n=1 Tax=Nocardia veterana TaxID=132249 RepID=A0A7X6M357_9NOCA|nr:hypothetical protein [Nocardia veterana]NKY88889.1 hypothetical protein [Nocardia veterana]
MPRTARAIGALLAAAALLSGCGGSDHGARPAGAPTADPNRPPSGLHWEKWQEALLPYGDDGPKHVESDAATGFSDTPQGAALAAMQHAYRSTNAPDSTWYTVAARVLVANPGKDAWVTTRALYSVKAVDPSAVQRYIGYQITSWTKDRAAITLYTSYPDGSLLATDTVVTWIGGDWRLQLPDPADKTPTKHAVLQAPAAMVKVEARS